MNITIEGHYKLRSSRARPNWYTNDPGGSLLRAENKKDRHTFLRLDEKTWDEMGRPDIITVTIKPGDRLNA